MKGPPITNDSIAGLSEKLTSVSETKFLDVIQYLSEGPPCDNPTLIRLS